MKRSNHARFFVSLVLLVSLLAPVTALAAGDGKKHFKEGMKYEAAEQHPARAVALLPSSADARACVKLSVSGGTRPSGGSLINDVRRSMIRLGSQLEL